LGIPFAGVEDTVTRILTN